MKNQFQYFKSLHETEEPLLIANVWNAQSASIFEKLNYRALATSSAAVAETLGYADGQQMSFDEYVFVIKSIVRSTSLPVSVDLEAGYGETIEKIIDNIRQLEAIGVSGINIEDSIISNGQRSLLDAALFAAQLKKIIDSLTAQKVQMFINVRSDVFLLGIPSSLEEAKSRAAQYAATGVHGLFFPCITVIKDIQSVVQSTKLPVNVMCMPQLPGFTQLKGAGVKRISMGNFANKYLYSKLADIGERIAKEESFGGLF